MTSFSNQPGNDQLPMIVAGIRCSTIAGDPPLQVRDQRCLCPSLRFLLGILARILNNGKSAIMARRGGATPSPTPETDGVVSGTWRTGDDCDIVEREDGSAFARIP